MMQMGAGSTTRQVVVEVLAEADNFLKNAGLMGEAVKEVTYAFTGLEEKAFAVLNRVGRKMLMTSAAIQASITANTYAAAQWERQFTQVEKTIDGSRAQINALGKDLREISTRTPVSAGELAGIASVAGQLGIAVDSVEEFTEVAAELGVATDLSSTQAIVSLSRVIKVMGESETTVRNLANSLVYLGNTSNTTESAILNFAQNIAGTAGVVGLASDEVLGIATAFSSAGIEAEAGGTAVQKVLLAINEAATVGGEKLNQFSAVLGISNEEFQRMARNDPARIFSDFVDVLSDAGADAATVLRQLGLTDQRLTRAFLNVANSSEGVAGAIARSRREYAEGNALGEEAAKQFDTFIESLKEMRNVFAEIGRSLGEVFVEPMSEVIQLFTKLLRVVSSIPQPIMNFAGAAFQLAAGIGAVMGTAMVFGRFISMVEGLQAILRTKIVAGSIGGFLSGGAQGTLASGGGRIGGFLGGLLEGRTEKKLKAMGGWTETIARGANRIGQAFGGAARGLGQFIRMSDEQREAARGSLMGRARLAAGKPFRAMRQASSGVWDRVKQRAGDAFAGVRAQQAAAQAAKQQQQSVSGATRATKKSMDQMAMYAAQGSEKASGAIKQGQKEIQSATEETGKTTKSVARGLYDMQAAAIKVFLAYSALRGVLNYTNAKWNEAREAVLNYSDALSQVSEITGVAFDPTGSGLYDPGLNDETRQEYLLRLERENPDIIGSIRDAESQGTLSEELMNIRMRLEYGGATDEEAVKSIRDFIAAAFDTPIMLEFATERETIDNMVSEIEETSALRRAGGVAMGVGAGIVNMISPGGDIGNDGNVITGTAAGQVQNVAEFSMQALGDNDIATAAAAYREVADTFGEGSDELFQMTRLVLGIDDTLSGQGFTEFGPLVRGEDSVNSFEGARTPAQLAVELGRGAGIDEEEEGIQTRITPELLARYLREVGGQGAGELADVLDPLVTNTQLLNQYLRDGMPQPDPVNVEDTRTDFRRGLESFAPSFETQDDRGKRQLVDQFIEQQQAAQGLQATLTMVQAEMATLTSDAERAGPYFNQLSSAAERLRDAMGSAASSSLSSYLSTAFDGPIAKAEYLRGVIQQLQAAGSTTALNLAGAAQGMLRQEGLGAMSQLRARFGGSGGGGGGGGGANTARAREDYHRNREKREEDHLERLEDMREQYNERLEDAIKSTFNIVSSTTRMFSGRQESLTDIIWNFEDQNEKLAEFNSGIQRFRQMLTNAGADEQLQEMIISNLGLDDPKNFGQLDRILNDVDRMGGGLINELVTQADQRQGVVQETAKETTDEITESYDEQRDKVIESYEEQTEAAERAYERQLESAQSTAGGAASAFVSNQEIIDRAMESGDENWIRLAELAGGTLDGIEEGWFDILDDVRNLNDAIEDHVLHVERLERALGRIADMDIEDMARPWWIDENGDFRDMEDVSADNRAPSPVDLSNSDQNLDGSRNTRGGGGAQQEDSWRDIVGLHAGGIASGPTRALLGEGGFREAVIPLNQQGVSFLQQLSASMAVRTPTTGYGQGAGGSSQYSRMEHHEYGPITVQADDPNQMRKKLESRRRIQRLTQPPRAGIRS